MGTRRRRALVRGKPATLWFYADECIVLRHPRGTDETSVPVAHLIDESEVLAHRARLAAKSWVSPAALDEFDAIVAGARR